MNNSQKSILLIIFFSFAISCKLSKNSETEPNNTFTNANTLEINKEITGYLDSENDTDNYILNINDEQILRVELSGIKGVNHAIHIYKNDQLKPQLIKEIDDNRKSSSEIFANLYVQAGQYLFSITHGSRDIRKGNTETPYKLLITSRSFINEEREPDDTPYTATEITDKSITTGYYSPAQNSMNNNQSLMMKELDYYKFNVTVSDNIPVLINLSLSGVIGVDSSISLLNSGMEEILTVDNSGTGEGETISDFGIKESGEYFIMIMSKNFLFNHDVPYELKLDYKTYDQNSELESNNTIEKANNLSGNIINGRINGLADKDFYHFIPPDKNRYYKADCIGSEGLDIIITIYDDNKNKLFEINNAGAGEPEIIPPFIIKNSIFISISAISLSASESRYTFNIEKFESDDVMEIEPNNSKSTANILDKKISGFINYKNDKDYYIIKYDERKKVKISIKGVKNGKIRISTTDPLGFIIKSKDIDSDEGISFSEIFDKKGFIIIEPLSANFEFPYILSIGDL